MMGARQKSSPKQIIGLYRLKLPGVGGLYIALFVLCGRNLTYVHSFLVIKM